MQCLKCGKEQKYEFCRECKEIKHNASAMISQNKSKLEKLFKKERLTPQGFEKFILYTDNIKKYGVIYMKYKEIKEYKTFRFICGVVNVISVLIAIRSGISILIIRL